MKFNILSGFTDWLQKVIDSFKNMEPYELFIIGLGVGVLVIILIYIFVAIHYRRKRLKTHKITINFDGGYYQGSCDELVITAKKGENVDFTNVIPSKEGYTFNGFNFYKRFVASSVTKKGVTKDNITIEKYDGEKKDVIEMPDYDLYLVASYSEVRDDETIKLKAQNYYSDFLTLEDLISELKHMNEDKETYPYKINIVTSDKEPDIIFIFKELTIVGFIKNFKGITKVYLRTSDELDDKLLNPFYQEEDINDCYNWYSFVIMYNTKLSRFIRSFEESYKQIDCRIKTTSIEFNMICGSLSNLADPVVDRTLLLVEKYEKDRKLNPQPQYVIDRDLPPKEELEEEEKSEDLSFEERTSIILRGDVVGETEEDVTELDEAVMSKDESEITDEKIKRVFEGTADDEEENFMDRELDLKEEDEDQTAFLGDSDIVEENEETPLKEEEPQEPEIENQPNVELVDEEVEVNEEKAETTDKETEVKKEEEKTTEEFSGEVLVNEEDKESEEEVKKHAQQDIDEMFPKLEDPLRYARKVKPAIVPMKPKHVDGETVHELTKEKKVKKEIVKPVAPVKKVEPVKPVQPKPVQPLKPSKPVEPVGPVSKEELSKKVGYDLNEILDELDKIDRTVYEANDEVVDPKASKDYEVHEGEKLTDTERNELNIKRTALNYSRDKLINVVTRGHEDEIEIIKRNTSKVAPYTLKVDEKTYSMIYENRFGLVRMILRLDDNTAYELSKIHPNVSKSKFPIGFFWYQIYLDESFYKKSELEWLFERSRIFAMKLNEQEKRMREEKKNK